MPTTTYSYGYTVQTYIDWQASYGTDPVKVALGSDHFDSSLYPTMIQVQPEALNLTTAPKFEIQIGMTLHFIVRVYQIATVGSTKTYYWMNGNDVNSGLTMHFGNDASYFLSGSTTVGAERKAGSSAIDYTNTGGQVYWFTVKAQKAGTSLTDYISMTCDFSPNDFNASYGGDTNVSRIKSLTKLTLPPIITIGKNVPIPTYPNGFTTWIENTKEWKTSGNGGGGGSLTVVFDKCNNRWHAFYIGATTYDQKTGAGTVNWAVYTSAVSGDSSTYKYLSGPHFNEKAQDKKYLANIKAQKDLIHTIILGDCMGQSTGRVSGGPSKPAPHVPATSTTDQIANHWNPPPIKGTRNAPFTPGNFDSKSYITTELNTQDFFSKLGDSVGNLGKLVQDPQGAATLNTNPDNITKYAVGKGQSAIPWGFKFMYNPTTFSYSSSSNNAVDWTLGSSDPTVLLQGNQSVTFELYLNRVIDMRFLNSIHGLNSDIPDDVGSQVTDAYGVNIGADALNGIYNRGTEYDIEFLYRVLNGDPLKNPLLFGDDYRAIGETADFGYTTATPCWLVLNDNLRYFGSVASMSVNHVIFDLRMVPLLSVVNVTFTRYPALWSDPNASKGDKKTQLGSYTAFRDAIKGSITSTGTPPQ
jgi:hypothetical protein